MADRAAGLEQWWETLDAAGRQHVRQCVKIGRGDAEFVESLRRVDVALVATYWPEDPGSSPLVPNDVADFVEARPGD